MTTDVTGTRTASSLLDPECCVPVVGQVLSPAAAESLASSLKALADPTRLRLVSLVAAHDDAEACVCDLTAPVGLSQPTVSHHLKVLVDAGILTREQRGRWAYYRLVPDVLAGLARLLTP
ncbi:MAG: ArsR/SmtB family transcription factor [Janthinobacterium lividum]